MGFAAGAREIAMPVFGIDTLKSERELDAFVAQAAAHAAHRVHGVPPARDGEDERRPARRRGAETGETWQVDNLFVADGSVLPTSIGVNSQLPIMGVAHKIATGIADDWARLARRAA